MPTVPELKEKLVELGLDWKQGDLKADLEKKIATYTPLDTLAKEVASDISNPYISDAPDPTEAPDYIGTAELKSQVSGNSSTPGSDTFSDPNWGDK